MPFDDAFFATQKTPRQPMPERFRIGCDHRRMALIRPEIANARIKASSAIFSCVFKDLFLALHSHVTGFV